MVSHLLSDTALDALFRKARTHNAWLDKPVSDDLLRKLYDLMKWGPTSANCCPARILFLRTPEAKQRLAPALAPGNLEKTMKAPVTAIIAHETKFYEQLPRLFLTIQARASGSPTRRNLRRSPPFATAPCKAAISSSRRARWGSTAALCPASTTQK